MTTSRAVLQRSYGPPEVLVVEQVDVPDLQPGEIRVRSLASAVNFSDLQIRQGTWPLRPAEPFPYVPGLEVVGEVVEVAPDVQQWRTGDVVTSMMQGMGGVRADRPGGYAELVTMQADAAARVPQQVDPVAAATVGLAGVTAFAGLQRLGDLDGARLAVTGATGGVGSMAVRIAAALGARVIAVVSRPGRGEDLLDHGADQVVPAAELAELHVDAVLDGVAGPVFADCIAALQPGGHYSLIGAAAGGHVSWDAYRLLDGITLTGWSSETLDGPGLRALWDPLTALLVEGRMTAPEPTVVPLAEAARGHQLLESRAVSGRVVLV